MRVLRFSLLVTMAVAFAACTDEVVQYVNRPFNPPVDQTNGFLGYFDATTKQTSCGNCHVSAQSQWVASAHADAWAGLQSSSAANASCEGCHTVSERGNMVNVAAGYNTTADASYHDVQCESCHGPGFDHASLPDASALPLAKLAAHVDDTLGTCGDCHAGAHHPFVEEWEQSRHSEGSHEDNPTCVRCHEGRGIMQSWGIDANYVERDDAVTSSNTIGITCAVCHDPHGSANPAQLRWPLNSTDLTQNLCMKCHSRRTEPLVLDSTITPPQSGSNSPHAPQGAVLIGDVGYQNPSYLDPVLINVARSASHGNATKNPRLCAGCHVYPFQSTDVNGNTFYSTGHLFRPVPCYDANGVPTDTILNCSYDPTFRSFRACATAGCHLSEAEPAGLMAVARGRIQSLTADLWVNSNTASSGIDTLDGGILPAILKATWAERGTLNNLSLLANGAFVLGDSVINLDATTLTGKLAVGNTIRIGTTQYTVKATVTAATNRLNGVGITPPLVAPLADNTQVLVMYLGPLVANDRVVTPVDGAEFNVRTFGEDAAGVPFGSTSDRSHTVHNPFLAEAMLRANIEELTDLYGSQPWFPVIAPGVRQIMAGPLGATGAVPYTRPQARTTAGGASSR